MTELEKLASLTASGTATPEERAKARARADYEATREERARRRELARLLSEEWTRC